MASPFSHCIVSEYVAAEVLKYELDFCLFQDNWNSDNWSCFCKTTGYAVQHDTSTAAAGTVACRSCL